MSADRFNVLVAASLCRGVQRVATWHGDTAPWLQFVPIKDRIDLLGRCEMNG